MLKLNAAVTALLLMAITPWAVAEQKIGYIDVQHRLTASKAGQDTTKDLKKIFDKKKADIKKDEDKLKAMQKDFEKDKMLMSESQMQEKQNQWREKMQDYQKKVGDSEKELAKLRNEKINAMLKEVEVVIADVAKKNDMSMVVDKTGGGVVFADKSLDITLQVLKVYDSKYKGK